MRLGNSINFKTINGKSIIGEGDIFIDTSLYRIVNELPTDNIEEKIYVLVSYGSEIGASEEYCERFYDKYAKSNRCISRRTIYREIKKSWIKI